jgi:L-cysteine/cystine lyase
MTPEEARAQYPVLERRAYLNAGSAGPLARSTAEAVAAQRRSDLEDGRSGQPYMDAMLAARERVREAVAAEIGVPPDNVALNRATTDGCNIVVNGLDLGPGDEVVTTDAEHFGLVGALHCSGARVVVVSADLDALADAVTPRTRLVAVSHVLWTTGKLLRLEELRARLDVPLLVDGAQTVGAIPVAAAAFDFYTVSCHKWLCTPDSSGALYIRDLDSLRVRIPSYFSQAAYEPDGSFTPKAGARRFDTGWIAPGLLAGIQAALAVHPPWRFERALAMAERCRDRLLDAGLDVVVEPEHGTLVAFRAGDEARALAARAYEQDVVVREIPGTGLVRASCGYWTSDDDVARLVEAVRPAAAARVT